MDGENLITTKKALKLNLNESVFGSFAEIGAGQEVARNFFQAGGASGTIAKTISAYDMAFSDAIYGQSVDGRYVSETRLVEMLSVEYDNVTTLLRGRKPDNTCFFAFANTVTTINYTKDREGHGWLGVRFQLDPDHEPNQVVIHVRLLENDALLQQQTLGVLGVNLIYACFEHYEYPNKFLQSLLDNLSRDQVEITMIGMGGPELAYVDNRLLGVQLVKNGMTPAIMFDRSGRLQQPSDMIYKKDVVVLRGSFNPVTYVTFDMLSSAFSQFRKEVDYNPNKSITLCELTLNSFVEDGDTINERDFLDRVDLLTGMGQNVMVSSFRYYYKVVGYLARFKSRNLRVAVGVPALNKILDESYYQELKGGILEAFGRMFVKNMKLYVYPTFDHETKEVLTSKDVTFTDQTHFLFEFLNKENKVVDLNCVSVPHLQINSTIVRNSIEKNDSAWKEMVPIFVSQKIREKELFGYKKPEK